MKTQPWNAKLHHSHKKQKSVSCDYGFTKQKIFFNETEYDKLYLSGSAPARIYGTPKMLKFPSSDSFSKLRPIVSSIGNF